MNKKLIYGVPTRRRVQEAVVRVENQPYNFPPGKRRTPRLGGFSGHLWCQLSTTIAAATGTWGSLTPGTLTGQTVYSTATGVQIALPNTYKIINWWPTSFASGKTTLLLPNGNGTYDISEQAC